MPMDEATLRNLELFSTCGTKMKKEPLASVIDQTQTPWWTTFKEVAFCSPCSAVLSWNVGTLQFENLVQNSDLRHHIQGRPCGLPGHGAPFGAFRGWLWLCAWSFRFGQSLAYLPELWASWSWLQHLCSPSLKPNPHPCPSSRQFCRRLLCGWTACQNHRRRYDSHRFPSRARFLHELMKSGRGALRDMEIKEREATGIPSLKVKFNRVFGYTIEISSAHSSKVPAHYVRRQTLANAERYVTEELKAYEEKSAPRGGTCSAQNWSFYRTLKERVLEQARLIKLNAQLLAELDVLTFAQTAIQRRYTCPNFIPDAFFGQKWTPSGGGKHASPQYFCSKRHLVCSWKTQLKLITGPNMSGKSTYLRQSGLDCTTFWLRSGPCACGWSVSACFDCIFTRVELATIWLKASLLLWLKCRNLLTFCITTEKSLIILDEVGRGTSTYDGWASPGPFGIFAR